MIAYIALVVVLHALCESSVRCFSLFAGLLSDLRYYTKRAPRPDKESTYKFKGLNRYFTDDY